MEEQEVQEMAKGDSPINFFKSHLRGSNKLKKKMLVTQEELWQACQDADAIIYHPGLSNGYFIAKELNIPGILASYFPISTTKDYPAILFYNGPRLGRLYNYFTHLIFEQLFWLISRPAIKTFWKNKSKPEMVTRVSATRLQALSGMPIIYGYSELVFARPKKWKKNIVITGYWILDDEPNWTPTPDLVQFIRSGTTPLYIGFGSIKDISRFKETIDIICKALEITKQRAVIALGWNNLGADITLPENILLIENAPHSWLFPQMAAVVHHGGAGTTAAGLYAGKPTIIIPHTADQPAWGSRVYELGVGPKPIMRKRLNADNLAEAIQAALNQSVIAKASELGGKLREEDGVINAVGVINNFLNL